MADPEGAEGAYTPPPKIAVSMGLQVLEKSEFGHISGTIQPTEMANHSLESVQEKQYKGISLVILRQRKLSEILVLI